jgi:hypothetical protein
MTKFASLVLLGALLVPAAAGAQTRFGTAGRFAISAERITSINHSSWKSEDEEADASSTTSYTNIALFASPLSPVTSGYSFPRIGADYFVIDGLSLGAALGIVSTTSSQELEMGDTSVESDGDSLSGFLFAPRVGYAFMFSDNVGIWPRAGITYVTAGTEEDDGDEFSASRLALTLEVPFVLAPVPHVAFTAGPTLDLGVSGSTESDPQEAGAPTVETDQKVTDIGLNVGMTVYF